MFRFATILLCVLAACGPVSQPESIRTVAAYEVPLPTREDKELFLALLREVAEANGYKVYAATQSKLEAMSEVSPVTFRAAVWRGDDKELLASAGDHEDRIGRVWIGFMKGEDPSRSNRFREALMDRIRLDWPATASLPVTPDGVIPLTEDLVRTPSGYQVRASAASKYQRTVP